MFWVFFLYHVVANNWIWFIWNTNAINICVDAHCFLSFESCVICVKLFWFYCIVTKLWLVLLNFSVQKPCLWIFSVYLSLKVVYSFLFHTRSLTHSILFSHWLTTLFHCYYFQIFSFSCIVESFKKDFSFVKTKT